jgi:hypothetical protein
VSKAVQDFEVLKGVDAKQYWRGLKKVVEWEKVGVEEPKVVLNEDGEEIRGEAALEVEKDVGAVGGGGSVG